MNNEDIDIDGEEIATDEQQPDVAPKKKGRLSFAAPKQEAVPIADDETLERAEEIGDELTGDPDSGILFALDTIKMIAADGVDGILETFENLSKEIAVLDVTDPDTGEVRRYHLTNLLKINRHQFEPGQKLLSEIFGGLDGFDMEQISRLAFSDPRVEQLLAILYVREGVTWVTPETIAAGLADMQYTDLGRRIGAIYRFFTSAVPFATGVIRASLKRLAMFKLMSIAGS